MGIPFGKDWICKGSVILGLLNAFATFMTLGVIALNRYILLVTKTTPESFQIIRIALLILLKL